MEITCSQMDVLISFYIEGSLSKALKEKVEKHLEQCTNCREKYNIIKDMLEELKPIAANSDYSTQIHTSNYHNYKDNLSAYIDNELSPNENIKIKRFTINNKEARKYLENTYNIRQIMNNSFKKSELNSKEDFSKKIIKQIQPEEYNFSFNPIIKYSMLFLISTIIISIAVIYKLNF